jgi:cell wall assembly regulator SMI1
MRTSTRMALKNLFEKFPALAAEGANPEEINSLEAWISFPLPSDYREFLVEYGGAIVGALPIYGLRRPDPMAEDASTAMELTEHFRKQGWPETDKWLVISNDHSGNPIGIDAKGEIWMYDHDNRRKCLVSPTFEEFLVKCLNRLRTS